MKKYKVEIDNKGTINWYKFGTDKLHREEGPAYENADGDKVWCLNDKRHREDGPAVEYANGNKFWCIKGKLHREDGPAVEYTSGRKEWYLNDVKVDKYIVLDTLEKQEAYVLREILEAL